MAGNCDDGFGRRGSGNRQTKCTGEERCAVKSRRSKRYMKDVSFHVLALGSYTWEMSAYSGQHNQQYKDVGRMEWQPPEGMNDYLKATRLCDCDDVKLKEKAKEIVGSAKNQEEAALRIFHFVRDKLLFGINYPDTKASKMLNKRIGFCMTKTNLHMALLRAVDIPSRCHLVELPRELFKNIMPKFMYAKLPATQAHPWCDCYLSGKWISCEALYEDSFYKTIMKTGIFTEEEMPTIDWDGKTDLILNTPWFVKDYGTFASWDDAMTEVKKSEAGMPPTNRIFGWLLLSMINRNIDAIRLGQHAAQQPTQ